jgi:glycosyltransferase involved in cell wall biosynthesis
MEANRAEDVLNRAPSNASIVASRPPVNVLFAMIQMAMGGSERLIWNLVANLDRTKFAPSLLWFRNEKPLREFQALGIPLHYVPKTKRFDWKAIAEVGRIVREQRIDVINAHHFMPFFYAYYAAKIANRACLVYTEHSEMDVLSAKGKWRVVGGRLLRSCDAVVGVSDRVSETLGSHFAVNPDRVHTIENGVDVELFGPSVRARARVRKELGFEADEVVIGHVANFRRNKNHLFLLKAFGEIARRDRRARLVFVGQGFPQDPENSEPDVRGYVRQHGLDHAVRLLGYRPDVNDVLRSMDVSCLVSYKEGLPLSLIEAMASGLAVVGTDIPSIRSVIDHDVNGLVVAPDDVPSLAHALSRLIDDDETRRRMGEESRRIAVARYSLARCVRETERLFLSTLARRDNIALPAGLSPAPIEPRLHDGRELSR